MTQAPPYAYPEPGRSAAFATYVLYILSIPSAGVLALIGVIVAYVARAEAQGAALSHLADQIGYWWTAFWWAVGLAVVSVIGGVLTIVLIGFPILWLAGLAYLIVMVWFTAKSVLGLIALLDGRGR